MQSTHLFKDSWRKTSGILSRLGAPILAIGIFSALNLQALPVALVPIHGFLDITNGDEPGANLVFGADGALYGTGANGGLGAVGIVGGFGSVFKINRDGSGFQLLHLFNVTNGSDGSLAGLIGGDRGKLFLGVDHFFYGATPRGGLTGIPGYGIVYKITGDGGTYQILHQFDHTKNDFAPTSVIQATNGLLYGTTGPGSGLAFCLDTNGDNYTVLTNLAGGSLGSLLQASDGALYGTTTSGGASNAGTVFRLNLDGSGYQVLHEFNGSDGSFPNGTLLQLGAFFAGVTKLGGSNNLGTIFLIGTNGSSFSVAHSFGTGLIPAEGTQPTAGLVPGPGGLLFGTASLGGIGSEGTLFAINPNGSGYQQLFQFMGAFSGAGPAASLTPDPSQPDVGVLYGTTTVGGPANLGNLFALLISPPLSVTPVSSQTVSNQTTLFWPSWAINYVLQTSTNLTSGPWQNVTDGTPVTGIQLSNPTNSPNYYRLIAPN